MYTNAQSNRTSIDVNLESILLTEEASLIYKLVTLNKNVNLVATLIVTQWKICVSKLYWPRGDNGTNRIDF